MKKLTFAAFIAFWASVITLAALHWVTPEPPEIPVSDLPEYSLADVAEHDSLDGCWMAIEGKVYDFTDYIPEHPAPERVMTAWCGSEATEGMRTKGYGRDHSPTAWAMMEPYLIGRLKLRN